MLEQAIDDYHALLDADMARATQTQLNQAQRERDLFFGERPLASVLRPRFISTEQYAYLRAAVGQVAVAARKLAAAVDTEPDLKADLCLTPAEEAVIAWHPGYDEPSAHGRMDTFLTIDGSSLQFVEYNAESPAAIAYEDVLSEVFLDLPAMRAFADRYTIRALPARQRLLATLLDCWRAFGGSRAPTIAIVDWQGLPTHAEFRLFQRYFHDNGLDALICAPDDLAFRDGRLYARDPEVLGPPQAEVPIDLVYKRVLTSEFLMHYGEGALDHPLTRAYASGAICMVNSFRAKLLHKKSIFALLTDERYQDYLTADERAAVRRHVPWTRIVRPGRTTYQGGTIDLLDFASRNQERLLLKPNDEYGGKGIVIGWETGAAEWAQALAEALQSPFVLQERVTIAYEDYPALVDGQLQIGRRLVDSDPFLFGAESEGSLCRLSTVTLLNVTAGGGSTVPVFVIEKRNG